MFINKAKCFYCKKEFEYEGEKYQDVKCPFCSVQNSYYPPATPDKCFLCGAAKDENRFTELHDCCHCGRKLCKICFFEDNHWKAYCEFYDMPERKEEMALIEPNEIKVPFFKNEDMKSGEIATIESEAVRMGTFQTYTCTMLLPSGLRRLVSLNATSLSNLCAAWSNDTTAWIGKKVKYSIENIKNNKTGRIIENCRIFRPVE